MWEYNESEDSLARIKPIQRIAKDTPLELKYLSLIPNMHRLPLSIRPQPLNTHQAVTVTSPLERQTPQPKAVKVTSFPPLESDFLLLCCDFIFSYSLTF